MACRICKRGVCTESFHSIAEQEAFDALEECENCGTMTPKSSRSCVGCGPGNALAAFEDDAP